MNVTVVLPNGQVVPARRGQSLPNGSIVRTGPHGHVAIGSVTLGPGSQGVVSGGQVFPSIPNVPPITPTLPTVLVTVPAAGPAPPVTPPTLPHLPQVVPTTLPNLPRPHLLPGLPGLRP